MNVTINGCRLNVEVFGPEDGPVLIAHHGGGGIGSLAEPRASKTITRKRSASGPNCARLRAERRHPSVLARAVGG
jgi:hypothetical protein